MPRVPGEVGDQRITDTETQGRVPWVGAARIERHDRDHRHSLGSEPRVSANRPPHDPGEHRDQHDGRDPRERGPFAPGGRTVDRGDGGSDRRRFRRHGDERLQVAAHLARTLITAGGLAGHGAAHDGAQRRSELPGQIWPRARDHRERHAHEAVALEGEAARGELIQRDAEAVDVAPVIGSLAEELLRGHVGGGAHDRPRGRRQSTGGHRQVHRRRGAPLSEPEVQDLHVTVGGHDDVGRLEVTVHDSPRMRGSEAVAELHPDVQHTVDRQRTANQPRREGLARHVLHHDVRDAIGFEHVVDAGDVGVIQRRGGGALLQQPPELLVAADALQREALQRDRAAQAWVVRQEHFSHAAGTELLDHAVRPDHLVRWHVNPPNERMHGEHSRRSS